MEFGIAHLNANWHDWDRHLAADYSKEPETPDHQLTTETFQLTDLAEDLGFDSVWSPRAPLRPLLHGPGLPAANLLLCGKEPEAGRCHHGRSAALA